MKTPQEAVTACLTLPGVYEDHPFGDDTTVIRHGANKKSAAFVLRQGDVWMLNVKADPVAVHMWQQIFPAVKPAYHMNKEHWLSIVLDGTMADEDIMRLVWDSYHLTQPKQAKKKPLREGEDMLIV